MEECVNDIAPTRFKWVGTRPIRPDGVPKVTGRAMYGADFATAGTLYGKIIRSPHAHARIRSIDTSKAEALPGVKAVVAAKDFPDHKFEYQGPERVQQNFWHMTRNVMAREKALYEGHAVAAVAAISKSVADEAAALIEIDYEVLPHVIDVDEAMKPDAPLLVKKAGRPVKIVMSRDEVFKASGPTSGSSMRVKIGVKKDGTIAAAEGEFKFQAGAFPGSPVMNACMCAFAPYNIPNQHTIGYDVVCSRPKSAAYRAPGSPISAFAAESVLDILAKKIGMDPLQLRLKNAARAGTPMIYGPKLGHGGYVETVEALVNHPAYKTPLGRNQGPGAAAGYWFNGGGESSASVQVNEDGTVIIATGSPDIGGSRASMALMAAETLGIDYHQIRSIVADTSSVGYTHVTGGSRVTFATGMAVVEASKKVVDELRARAAMIWDVDVEGVVWEDGQAKPASSNVGDFAPLSFKELAAKKALTGGPITAAASVNAGGMAPGFSTQFCDVEVDPETGKVTILRFIAAQDVGKAIHPSYVEGQIQGGVAQGIGWALNEEYIYDRQGRLDNAGFLDYRVPVASDMPMIEAVMVEVPNPAHPYGAKGGGAVNIVPPMSAIANAIVSAIHRRLTELPMSPPKVRAALDQAQADD